MKELTSDKADLLKRMALEAIDLVPDYGAFFKLQYLRKNAFRAAIFEGDFRDADNGVSKACHRNGISALSCVSFDTHTTAPAFRLEPSHENLKSVREQYHTPSYLITDDFNTLIIVSDSDYYWSIASSPEIVASVSRANASLIQKQEDIEAFLASSDAHNVRIGEMLRAFHDTCNLANSVAS